jgi:hypothetical protein
MSEKKVVDRNVAIALGIICVILAVGLVGAIANEDSLNSQITSLQTQVSDLTSLTSSTVWVDDQSVSQSASGYTYWDFSANYAGYVSVAVGSSTTSNTYVEVSWFAYLGNYKSISYDSGQISVGYGNTVNFPILPSSNIEIRVGNTNLINGASETVTITYYC